jgi:hypothetical protein
MNYLKDNREIIALVLIIAAVFAGVCGVSHTVRGGQPWAYAGQSFIQTVQAAVAK